MNETDAERRDGIEMEERERERGVRERRYRVVRHTNRSAFRHSYAIRLSQPG
jgi:hypothetical protein